MFGLRRGHHLSFSGARKFCAILSPLATPPSPKCCISVTVNVTLWSPLLHSVCATTGCICDVMDMQLYYIVYTSIFAQDNTHTLRYIIPVVPAWTCQVLGVAAFHISGSYRWSPPRDKIGWPISSPSRPPSGRFLFCTWEKCGKAYICAWVDQSLNTRYKCHRTCVWVLYTAYRTRT